MTIAYENLQKSSAKLSWPYKLILILLGICSGSKCAYIWGNFEGLHEKTANGDMVEYKIPENEISVQEIVHETNPPIYDYTIVYKPERNIMLVQKSDEYYKDVETEDGVLFAQAGFEQTIFMIRSKNQFPTADVLQFLDKVAEIDKKQIFSNFYGPRIYMFDDEQLDAQEIYKHLFSNHKILNLIKAQNYLMNQSKSIEISDIKFFTFGPELNRPSFDNIIEAWKKESTETLKNVIEKEMMARVDALQKENPKKKKGSSFMSMFDSNPDTLVKKAIQTIIQNEVTTFKNSKAMFNSIKQHEKLISDVITVDLLDKFILEDIEIEELNLILIILGNELMDATTAPFKIGGDWNNKDKYNSEETLSVKFELYDYFINSISTNLKEYVTEQLMNNEGFTNSLKDLTFNINGSISNVFTSIREEIEKEWSSDEAAFVLEEEEVYKEKWNFIPFVIQQYVEMNKQALQRFLDSYITLTKNRTYADRFYLDGDSIYKFNCKRALAYFDLDHLNKENSVSIYMFKNEK